MVRAKRRALALTGAAILIAAVIIVAVAHTPAVNRYALERLQAYLRTEYGIELQAGCGPISSGSPFWWKRRA